MTQPMPEEPNGSITPAVVHQIDVRSFVIYGTQLVHVAVCSCGTYKSGPCKTEVYAASCGRRHVRAKRSESASE